MDLFPGFVPKTETGKSWRPNLPVMCIMAPDFEILNKKKLEIKEQIESDLEMALALSYDAYHHNQALMPLSDHFLDLSVSNDKRYQWSNTNEPFER